jgi:replicative DNA helicase
MILEEKPIDAATVIAAITHQRLFRRDDKGQVVKLQPEEAINLVVASAHVPEQIQPYLALMERQVTENRQSAIQERVRQLAANHKGDVSSLITQLREVEASVGSDMAGSRQWVSEIEEIIPYVQDVVHAQQGREYVGLNSGFPHLNNLVNGLDTGLGVLAAPPGRGKTTLLFQIAYQAAELNAVPVFFVSMEQGKRELRAKALANFSDINYRHILRGRLQNNDPNFMEALLNAAQQYANAAKHLHIIEGDGATTVDEIQSRITAIMAAAGASRCFVCLDYLQILPLTSDEARQANSAKDKMDILVSRLRRMARDLDSPVWAISAMSRAAYDKASLDAFKESGGIEYSADLAMILSSEKGAPQNPEHLAPEQHLEFTELDLKVIKNRTGEQGIVQFKFYPRNARFVEIGR